MKPVYNKLRGRPEAILELVQGARLPQNERYALSGRLKIGKTEFLFKGTVRLEEPKGALFDPSEFGHEITGRLALQEETGGLELKVLLEQGHPLPELLVCRFLVISRPPRRDGRLVGQWHWFDFYPSGNFSASVHRYWAFGANGRVLDSQQSFASSQLRGQDGSWAGLSSVESHFSAGDRGTWQADGETLTIQWDDGKSSEFNYELDRKGMLLRWSKGQRYWERM